LCAATALNHCIFKAGDDDMNRDITQGNFTQLKGKIKEQWGKLTDDEIDELEGKSEILAGKLQERYGWNREQAEREVKEFRARNNWN